jgi:hypothetical protein
MDVALSLSDAEVHEPGGPGRPFIHRVAPVHEERHPHDRAEPFEREVRERFPLGHQDEGVGSGGGGEGVVGDLDDLVERRGDTRYDGVEHGHERSGTDELRRDVECR